MQGMKKCLCREVYLNDWQGDGKLLQEVNFFSFIRRVNSELSAVTIITKISQLRHHQPPLQASHAWHGTLDRV